MLYTYIAFDIDGTLLDTAYTDVLGLRKAIEEVAGREEKLETLRLALGMPSVEILHSLGIRDPARIEQILPLWSKYRRERFDTVRLFPGILEMLSGLEKTGVSLGIVTSKNARGFQEDFEPFGVADRFSPVVLSNHTERHKPYPDPLLEFIRIVGARPEEVLYVGDSVYDQRCADAAGVDFALAVWGSVNPAGMLAKYRLNAPIDLLKSLGKSEAPHAGESMGATNANLPAPKRL